MPSKSAVEAAEKYARESLHEVKHLLSYDEYEDYYGRAKSAFLDGMEHAVKHLLSLIEGDKNG